MCSSQFLHRELNGVCTIVRVRARACVRLWVCALRGSMTDKQKQVTVDWVSHVAAAYCLQPDTLALAKQYFYSYTRARLVGVKDLQLVGAACLFIACKFDEVLFIASADLADLSGGAFTKDELLQRELDVVSALQFDLMPHQLQTSQPAPRVQWCGALKRGQPFERCACSRVKRSRRGGGGKAGAATCSRDVPLRAVNVTLLCK